MRDETTTPARSFRDRSSTNLRLRRSATTATRTPAYGRRWCYLFAEWNDKAAGFVGYGLNGGIRAVEHLRGALSEVKVGCVRSQVALSLFADFAIDDMTQPGTFTPAPRQTGQLQRVIDEIISWADALKSLRAMPTQLAAKSPSAAEAPFTMLIEFAIPPQHQHEFADRLGEQIAESLPAVGGFLSARVQASVDGSTVINYAQWASRSAWETATGLSAADTGGDDDRSWAESRRDRWFDDTRDGNPVTELLSRLGGSTRRVTAFDHSMVVTA